MATETTDADNDVTVDNRVEYTAPPCMEECSGGYDEDGHEILDPDDIPDVEDDELEEGELDEETDYDDSVASE